MPPAMQKRQRKEGRTLHHFFSAKSVTRQEPQKSGRTSKSTQPILTQEVIIIDSDSDDSIEIVEGIVEGDSSLRGKRRKLSPSKYSQQTKVEECHNQSISFGKPFLLCPSSPLKHSDGNPCLEQSPLDAVSTLGTCNGKIDSLEGFKGSIDLTLNNWNDGDDEITAHNFLDADASISFPDSEREWEQGFNADADDTLFEDETQQSEPTFVGSMLFPETRARDANHDKSCKTEKDNAFSVLMSSFKEKEAWKEADIAEDKTHRARARRKAPFYKVLQGMPIAVDAFRYGAIPKVNAYFLTHAHSDHYTNLSSSWKNGPIYCSEGTANLIIHMLNVDKKWIRPLPMDTAVLIPDTNGVNVTLIEANHCPGSCLFFFEGPQSVNAGDSNFKSSFIGSSRIFRYLHCGDFRASPQHVMHPAVRGKTIDHVYLDTTYLDPRYTFPPQPLVISACAELAKRLIYGEQTKEKGSSMLSWLAPISATGKELERPKPLIVVGTYSIGKERIVKAIAQAVNSKIYCDSRKAAILRCQADPELDALLTSDPKDSIVHLVPLATISTDRLKVYLEHLQGNYSSIIGFRPTGWTYNQSPGADPSPTMATILSRASEQKFSCSDLRPSPKSTPMLKLYPVPYSEHSSFNELTCFAMSFSWVKMIATVNVGNEASRAKMAKWVAKWEAERKRRGGDTIVPPRHPDYW